MKLQAGPEDRGRRVDVFLAGRMDRVTRSHIQALNKSGAILINGLHEKDGYRLRGTETIEVDMAATTAASIDGVEPRPMSFSIYYEDDDLAVLEKPAGVVVHPGAATGADTMVHGLLFHFQHLSNVGGPIRPGI